MFISGWTDKNGDSLTYEPLGVFTKPDGKSWSTVPYTKEQRKVHKTHNRFLFIRNKVIHHLLRTNRGIFDEIELIKQNKSTLPRYARDWLINSI